MSPFSRLLQRTDDRDLDQRRLYLIFLSVTLTIFFIADPLEPLGLPLFLAFPGLYLVLFYFAWRGVLWPVRFIMPLAGFLLITHFVYVGGIYDEALEGYYFVLAVAGLMIGRRALLFFGAASTLVVLILGTAEAGRTLITPFHPVPPQTVVYTAASFLFATTLALNFLVVRLNHALRQAQRQEAELERRVDERTAELDFANQQLADQLERINSLQARLREEAIRDPLTGLFNRRYLDEVLPIELARSQRSNLPIAILILDLDHFKRINDTQGHPVGDLVLQAVAEVLKKNIRAGDIVCRYGGEEFLLVLPGMGRDDAHRRAEKLCALMRAPMLDTPQGPLQVTVSIGASLYPEHGLTAEALISLADQSLYRAKQNGRDRVEFAPSLSVE